MTVVSRDVTFNLLAKTAGFESGMQRASRLADEVADKMQRAGDRVAGIGRSLTTTVTLPIVGAGVAMFNMAAGAEEAANQIQQVFGDDAARIAEAAQSANDAFSETDFLRYAGNIGDIAQGMGIARDASDDMALSVLELAQDLSSFKDVPVEQAVQAITRGLTGEREMLKSLGIVILEADVKQKALAMGLWDGVGALDSSAKALASYALITEKSANAVGDWDRTADSASNSIKTARANFVDLATDLGAKLIPIGTRIVQFFTDLIERFQRLSPRTQDIIVKVAGIAAAVGPLLIVGGKLLSLFGLIVAHPIVAAIAGLAAAFVYAYQNSEQFREVVDGVLRWFGEMWTDYILPAVKVFIEWFRDKAWPVIEDVARWIWEQMQDLWAIVKPIWDTFYEIVKKLVEWFQNTGWPILEPIIRFIWEAIQTMWDIVEPIWEGFKDAVQFAAEFLRDTAWPIIETIADKIGSAFSTMKDIVMGVWETLKEGITGAINFFIDKVNGLIRLANKLPFVNIGEIGRLGEGGDVPAGLGGAGLVDPGALYGNTAGALSGGRHTNGGVTVNVNVAGSVRSDQDLADFVVGAVDDGFRTGRIGGR